VTRIKSLVRAESGGCRPTPKNAVDGSDGAHNPKVWDWSAPTHTKLFLGLDIAIGLPGRPDSKKWLTTREDVVVFPTTSVEVTGLEPLSRNELW
jgi:hypothetical protein